jgi:coenzyme Q-binding protein COQ10
MPRFQSRRRVRHRADDMFALVADVESYPQFLPFCVGLKVRRREEDAQGRTVLKAEMEVGFKAIREKFMTKVTLDAQARAIDVAYLDGPFKYLNNKWRFIETGPGETGREECEVDFFIDYEFRSMVLGLLMGAMFDQAFRNFTKAFEDRADAVYGRSHAQKT